MDDADETAADKRSGGGGGSISLSGALFELQMAVGDL